MFRRKKLLIISFEGATKKECDEIAKILTKNNIDALIVGYKLNTLKV